MIKLGDNNIKDVYLGEKRISKIYKGDKLVYQKSIPTYKGYYIMTMSEGLPNDFVYEGQEIDGEVFDGAFSIIDNKLQFSQEVDGNHYVSTFNIPSDFKIVKDKVIFINTVDMYGGSVGYVHIYIPTVFIDYSIATLYTFKQYREDGIDLTLNSPPTEDYDWEKDPRGLYVNTFKRLYYNGKFYRPENEIIGNGNYNIYYDIPTNYDVTLNKWNYDYTEGGGAYLGIMYYYVCVQEETVSKYDYCLSEDGMA